MEYYSSKLLYLFIVYFALFLPVGLLVHFHCRKRIAKLGRWLCVWVIWGSRLTVNGLFLGAMIIYHTTVYLTGTAYCGLVLGFTCRHHRHLINKCFLCSVIYHKIRMWVSLHSLDFATRLKWEVSFTPRLLYSRRKSRLYPLYKRLGKVWRT